MKAIKVTCPQCGAVLDVGEADHVTCSYCGTPAQVQRRALGGLGGLSGLMKLAQSTPMQYAVQVRTISWATISMVFVAIAFVVVGVVCVAARAVHMAHQKAATRGGGATPTPGRILGWEGDSGGLGLLADADGDGDLDVIGRCREYGNVDAVTIVALDGQTGATLWESDKLGTYTETYLGKLALIDDTLVFASERGEVTAFAVRDGKRRWSTTLPERVATFCRQGDTLVAIGTDEVMRPLGLAEGEATPQAANAPCTPLPHDHDGGDLTSIREDAPYELAGEVGMSSADQITGPSSARVVAGTRAKGTGVPRLAALDERGHERWSADVPAEPLAAEERKPELVAVGADVTCASYELNDSKAMPHLVCFDLATGARRWDVALLDDSPLEGLQLTDVGVLIAQWGLLEVRDPANGALRWKFGGI